VLVQQLAVLQALVIFLAQYLTVEAQAEQVAQLDAPVVVVVVVAPP
jgi:hypothetical protein